jgi:CubicO group peptidase (beta-lactamase class C family)
MFQHPHIAPRVIAAAAGLLIIAGCEPASMPTTPGIGVDNPAIDAIFADWDHAGAPGCGIAVADNGELIYTRGYGSANLDYDIPNTPQTVFDVASITKQFTAASLTMLEEDGVLSLDDDVRQWLPELRVYDWPITLRHMLHNTSGLRDYLNLFPLAGRNDYYPISLDQILDMMARQRGLIFRPGERYEYSNSAYMLLAKVIERASGKSFGEFAKERIFLPLGMDASFMYEDFERIVPGRATGYARDDDGSYRVVHNYNFDVAGDGALNTTMPDLLRWDQWLHGEKPPIHDAMHNAGRLNNGETIPYAQGLMLGEYRGLETVGHSGSSWGFRSQLIRFIEPGLSIAVSCNQDESRPGDMARQVADVLLADKLGPPEDEDVSDDDSQEVQPEPVDLSRERLAAYAGEYYSPELDATYRFSMDDDKLVVRVELEPPETVSAVGDDRLEIRFRDQGMSGPAHASLVFERDASGAISGFSLSSGSENGLEFVVR